VEGGPASRVESRGRCEAEQGATRGEVAGVNGDGVRARHFSEQIAAISASSLVVSHGAAASGAPPRRFDGPPYSQLSPLLATVAVGVVPHEVADGDRGPVV